MNILTDSGWEDDGTGFVYVLRCEYFYKIGQTRRDVQSRIRAVQHGNPFEVSLFHAMKSDDPTRAEKYLHLKFADKRVRNEWFELSTADLDWLKKIKTISSDFLDKYDLTRRKPPASTTSIEITCVCCGTIKRMEKRYTDAGRYCSRECEKKHGAKRRYENKLLSSYLNEERSPLDDEFNLRISDPKS